MIRVVVSIILVCLTSLVAIANGPTHSTAVARKGDGAYALLRRYHLLEHSLNIQRFYEINSLDDDKALLEGREYKLPVLIYRYDGESIRSTIGVDDWDMARKIEEYNSLLLSSQLVNKPYIESLELWVPMHVLMVDYSEASPAPKAVNTKTLDVPLFGPDYSEVVVTSQSLKGRVFYIISGHGGPDPGAMSEANGHTLCEDEYAYDVALRLALKLMQHGAQVEIIVQDPNNGIRDEAILKCDKTELSMGTTQIPIRQLVRLQQRVHAVNEKYKEYKKSSYKDHTVICIHVDSRQPNKRQDVFFYYYEGSKSGKELADQLQDTFRDKYEKYRPGRGYSGTVSSRSLYVLKYTDPPAVYVELANIRNSDDLNRILPKDNRQALANWLFEGITK